MTHPATAAATPAAAAPAAAVVLSRTPGARPFQAGLGGGQAEEGVPQVVSAG